MSTPRKPGADLSNQPIHLRGNQHGAARQDLEHALAAVQAAGLIVPCRGPDRARWTSDSPTLQGAAARACRACPVLEPCRAYALQANEEGGTWGGLVPAERQRARRRAQNEKTRRADRAA